MLSVTNLSAYFRRYGGGTLSCVHGAHGALRGLDIQVAAGEILAVVGQSGSGKSLLAHAVMGLLPKNAVVSGSMLFKSAPLTPDRQRQLRGREIALIPQSVAYLNPLNRVGRQARRAAQLSGLGPEEARRGRDAAFARYGLTPETRRLFPFQISGGMARRVLTAAATAGKADLIIADEPTTGLDPQAARKSLGHLRLLADAGKAVLCITHDIAAALETADRVAVLFAGTTLEIAPAAAFDQENGLMHPYSRLLLRSLPQREFLDAVDNARPQASENGGCPYVRCCGGRSERCHKERPALTSSGQSLVRCHHA